MESEDSSQSPVEQVLEVAETYMNESFVEDALRPVVLDAVQLYFQHSSRHDTFRNALSSCLRSYECSDEQETEVLAILKSLRPEIRNILRPRR